MKFNILCVLLLGSLVTSSCKKEKTAEEPIDYSGVYIAGMQWDSVGGNDRACYWKNGKITIHELPNPNRNYYANALAVAGPDVYTAGYENGTSMWQAQVWKNGKHLYSLGDVYGEVRSIAVLGSDIYTGGQLYEAPIRHALYWKNSSGATVLASDNNGRAIINGICAAGSDLYAAGYAGNNGKLWKNGTEISLPNSTGCEFKAIAVSGTDVYVTGNIGARTIRYWKNNSHTDITVPAGREIYSTGIAVENNDVYIAGWESTGTVLIAKYWKNGNEVVLGDGVRHSYTSGIAVKDGKVYVAGNQVAANTTFPYYATLWEDGVAKVIGTRNSRATAVVVK